MLVGTVIFVAFIRLLLATERPFACALAYAVVAFFGELALGGSARVAGATAGLDFLYSWGWFALLLRTRGNGSFLFVLLLGLVLPSAARFLMASLAD